MVPLILNKKGTFTGIPMSQWEKKYEITQVIILQFNLTTLFILMFMLPKHRNP